MSQLNWRYQVSRQQILTGLYETMKDLVSLTDKNNGDRRHYQLLALGLYSMILVARERERPKKRMTEKKVVVVWSGGERVPVIYDIFIYIYIFMHLIIYATDIMTPAVPSSSLGTAVQYLVPWASG